MIFSGFSDISKQTILVLNKTLRIENELLSPIQIKINTCPFHVFLIAGDAASQQLNLHSPIEPLIIKNLHQTWEILRSDNSSSDDEIAGALATCDQYGVRVFRNLEKGQVLVYRFLGKKNLYFALILGMEGSRASMPLNELKWLAHLWKIENDYLPLHASGVIHRGGLFLFSAPSGTGKSTLAFMSRELGDELVDEDQVMVYRLPDGGYSAEGWGYTLNKTSAPVRGFFRIKQAGADRLVRLPPSRAARCFWEQSMVTTGDVFVEEIKRKLFEGVCAFSRAVPGYELHFRKSPDFWQLIDAEIPCD